MFRLINPCFPLTPRTPGLSLKCMAQLTTKLRVSNWNHMYLRPLNLTVGESANLSWKRVLSKKTPTPTKEKSIVRSADDHSHDVF